MKIDKFDIIINSLVMKEDIKKLCHELYDIRQKAMETESQLNKTLSNYILESSELKKSDKVKVIYEDSAGIQILGLGVNFYVYL